jgi:hypothetical protein
VVLLVVVSLAAGCAKADRDRTGPARPAAPDRTTTTRSTEDFVAQADDFVNLHDMEPVRGFFIANRSGHLDEALAIARADEGGTYPVGTIIQLFPQEAMVKRRAGFDPKSNDWEFFELDPSATGTVIHQRGGAEIVNRFGSGSCSSCHALADPKFDFVCEDTHGCDPLPFGRDVIDSFQDADPRPRAPSS